LVEKVHPRPAVVLWTLTAIFVVAHLVRSTGPVGDATYLTVIIAGPLVAALGARSSPPDHRRVLVLITAGLAASALGPLAGGLGGGLGGDLGGGGLGGLMGGSPGV